MMYCTLVMHTSTFLIFLLCFILVVGRPPLDYKGAPAPASAQNAEAENAVAFAIPGLQELEYGRYIQEVVNELEQDPNFRLLIESDNYTQAEDIAAQLALLSHSVRTRLDELKRREVERLVALQRALVAFNETKKNKNNNKNKNNQVLRDLVRVKMHHVDVQNPDKFGEADLVRLIRQTATDLEALDEVRRQQFKRYEMQKAYERLKAYKNKLPRNSTENKTADTKQLNPASVLEPKVFTRNASGVHINYPGRRAHLTDVWKNVDGQEGPFHSRTFFALHDTNTDGHWDFNEVNALMRRELDKLYPSTDADVQQLGATIQGDANERYEEMNRLREVFFEQIDSNKDALISLAEFFVWSTSAEFSEDEVVWKTLADASPSFTSAEFQQFMHDEGHENDVVLPVQAQGVL